MTSKNIQRSILKILQGKLSRPNGDNVPVVVRHYPSDKTPCVTITGEGGKPIDSAFVLIEPNTVQDGHPDYDPENPDKTVPQDVYYQRTNDTIVVNVWYTDKEDGYLISEQVENELFLARINHYTYCINYDKNTHICSTIGTECKARTSKTGMAVKGFCPSPDKYNCRNVLYEHFVLPTTFKIEATYNQDEYNKEQTLYRRIIKVNVDYYKTHLIGGKQFDPDNYIWED